MNFVTGKGCFILGIVKREQRKAATLRISHGHNENITTLNFILMERNFQNITKKKGVALERVQSGLVSCQTLFNIVFVR